MSNDPLAHLFDPAKHVYRVGDECTYLLRTFTVKAVREGADGLQRLDLERTLLPGESFLQLLVPNDKGQYEIAGELPAEMVRQCYDDVIAGAVSPWVVTSAKNFRNEKGYMVEYPTPRR